MRCRLVRKGSYTAKFRGGKLRSDTRRNRVQRSGDILGILFMSEITLKPIGQIRAQFSDADVRAERKDLAGDLELSAV